MLEAIDTLALDDDPNIRDIIWEFLQCTSGPFDLSRRCLGEYPGGYPMFAPIHVAVSRGKISALKFLLEDLQCDPNLESFGAFRETPLMLSLQNDSLSLDIVKLLLATPTCDVNYKTKEGYYDGEWFWGKSTLCITGWDDGIDGAYELFLRHPNVDVNLQEDEDGNTPLHEFCENGTASTAKIVKMLLDHPKINPRVKNNFGQQPLDVCRDGECPCKELLMKKLLATADDSLSN